MAPSGHITIHIEGDCGPALHRLTTACAVRDALRRDPNLSFIPVTQEVLDNLDTEQPVTLQVERQDDGLVNLTLSEVAQITPAEVQDLLHALDRCTEVAGKVPELLTKILSGTVGAQVGGSLGSY